MSLCFCCTMPKDTFILTQVRALGLTHEQQVLFVAVGVSSFASVREAKWPNSPSTGDYPGARLPSAQGCLFALFLRPTLQAVAIISFGRFCQRARFQVVPLLCCHGTLRKCPCDSQRRLSASSGKKGLQTAVAHPLTLISLLAI